MRCTVVKLEEKGFNREIQELMTRLLESDMVGSILLPKKTTGGDNYVQALVKNPKLLADTDISAPVMPVQSARLISNLTFRDPGEKIAVAVKPCEVRAVVELTKFKQVRRDSLFIIAVDCLGTYEPKVFSSLVTNGKDPAADLRKQAASGNCKPDEDASFRTACTMCEHPSVPLELVDLAVRVLPGIVDLGKIGDIILDIIADLALGRDPILVIKGRQAASDQQDGRQEHESCRFQGVLQF